MSTSDSGPPSHASPTDPPADPLALSDEDKLKIRQAQARTLREVGPGLDSMVKDRMPGSNKQLGLDDEDDDQLDRRRTAKFISWALFAILPGLIVWAVWVWVAR